jgi:hypothetical protein
MHHSKYESERVDGDGVEILLVRDAIALVVFKHRVLKNSHDDSVFSEPGNIFLILILLAQAIINEITRRTLW